MSWQFLPNFWMNHWPGNWGLSPIPCWFHVEDLVWLSFLLIPSPHVPVLFGFPWLVKHNSTLHDSTHQFIVEVDTSDLGVGAVLSQRDPRDNKPHPCLFYSQRLGKHRLLAIKIALEELCEWLEGTEQPFLVLTDYKDLCLHSAKDIPDFSGVRHCFQTGFQTCFQVHLWFIFLLWLFHIVLLCLNYFICKFGVDSSLVILQLHLILIASGV